MHHNTETVPGKIAWRSPSNIALVKYWGKKPVQLPANPSLSMTLSRAFTDMTLNFAPGDGSLEFLFEGKKQEKFERKIAAYLEALSVQYPVLKDFSFKLSSSNSFPHSTGIASSASSMSALGLCITDFLNIISRSGIISGTSGITDFQEASRLSRLASGSACRSVYGGYVIWGIVPGFPVTSDEYAVQVPFTVNPVFNDMRDSILIVSSKEKEVSSRAGHSLMEGHPYAESRYRMAVTNLADLNRALINGDTEEFIRITEMEALNLHALMMASGRSYILMEPGTLSIIRAVRRFRDETRVPVCFTLDAGPNVHLLFPESYDLTVKDWINNELVQYCDKGKWIDDRIGEGPVKIL
jgi:diphosphomevalonate decarboxylase